MLCLRPRTSYILALVLLRPTVSSGCLCRKTEDILQTTNIRFRGTCNKEGGQNCGHNYLAEELCGGDGCITTIVEAHHLLRGGGGESNKVPSNKNFVRNLSNRNYRNKLADTPIDIASVFAGASVASGVMSPTTRMVDQACIHALRMLVSKEDHPMTPRTMKRLWI